MKIVKNAALLSSFVTQSSPLVMDKFWSIFTMPIGLLICFGPALLFWLKMELNGSDKDEGQ